MVQASWISLRFPNRRSRGGNEEVSNCANTSSEVKGEDDNDTDSVTDSREWTLVAVQGSKPEPRCNHAATSVGRKMVVVGGESSGGLLRDVHILHLGKLTWSQIGPSGNNDNSSGCLLGQVIPAVQGHSLVSWGKIILLIGGLMEPFSDRVEVWALDIKGEIWSKVEAKGDIPVARCGQSVTKAGSILIMFGGEDPKGRKLKDLHMFDLKSFTWVPLKARGTGPSARSKHVSAMYNDKLLLIFGGASKSKLLNDTFSLDLETMEWSKIKAKGFTPSRRAGCSGVLLRHVWYIIGGEGKKMSSLETIAFNVATMTWLDSVTSAPNSVIGNKGLSVVPVHQKEGSFLVAFGGRKFNNELSNEVASQAAIPIPSSEVDSWQGAAGIAPLQNLFQREHEVTFEATPEGRLAEPNYKFVQKVANQQIGKQFEEPGSSRFTSEPLSAPSQFQGCTYGQESGNLDRRMNQNKVIDMKKMQWMNHGFAEEVFSCSDPPECSEARHCASECICDAGNKISGKEKGLSSDVEEHYEIDLDASIKKNNDGHLTSVASLKSSERINSFSNQRGTDESKLASALKEIEILKEKLAAAELAKEESNRITNIVHTENVRLEHDIAFLKAVLDDTQRELHTTRGILDAERTRAFQLQVEVFQLRQKTDSVDWRVLVHRKMH